MEAIQRRAAGLSVAETTTLVAARSRVHGQLPSDALKLDKQPRARDSFTRANDDAEPLQRMVERLRAFAAASAKPIGPAIPPGAGHAADLASPLPAPQAHGVSHGPARAWSWTRDGASPGNGHAHGAGGPPPWAASATAAASAGSTYESSAPSEPTGTAEATATPAATTTPEATTTTDTTASGSTTGATAPSTPVAVDIRPSLTGAISSRGTAVEATVNAATTTVGGEAARATGGLSKR